MAEVSVFDGPFTLVFPDRFVVTRASASTVNVSSVIDAAIVEALDGIGIGTDRLVFVDSLASLPAAVAGVITLADGVAYLVLDEIDLQGARLVAAGTSAICGTSSEIARIKSTGLLIGSPLLSSLTGSPLLLREVTLEAPTILEIDGQGDPLAQIRMDSANFDGTEIGEIRDVDNLIVNDSAWFCGGLVLDGTINTVAFFQTVLTANAAQIGILLPATLTINRRLRLSQGPFSVAAGGVGIQVDAISTTFPNKETFSILGVSFSGAGAAVTGATYSNTEIVVEGCTTLQNTASAGNLWMVGNATVTTIAAPSTYYKIAGTTSAGSYLSRFVHTTGRLTCTAAFTRAYRVMICGSLVSSPNNVLAVRLAVDGVTLVESEIRVTASSGGRVENFTALATLSLSAGQYIEAWVANITGANNITATHLQLQASAISS